MAMRSCTWCNSSYQIQHWPVFVSYHLASAIVHPSIVPSLEMLLWHHKKVSPCRYCCKRASRLMRIKHNRIDNGRYKKIKEYFITLKSISSTFQTLWSKAASYNCHFRHVLKCRGRVIWIWKRLSHSWFSSTYEKTNWRPFHLMLPSHVCASYYQHYMSTRCVLKSKPDKSMITEVHQIWATLTDTHCWLQ